MMKKLLKKFEAAMTAVTFAEAGEFATARELLNEETQRKDDPSFLRGKSEAGRILGVDQLYGEAGK